MSQYRGFLHSLRTGNSKMQQQTAAGRAMGNLLSWWLSEPEFKVHVTTGDVLGAGTDATVWIQLVDKTGAITEPPTCLDKLLVDDHERGTTHTYGVWAAGLKQIDAIDHVVVWRDRSGFGDAWFLDRIELEECTAKKRRYVFPVQRWIQAEKRYQLYQFDVFLPQDDPHPERRSTELEEKRLTYQYVENIRDGPLQVQELPSDEKFSPKYMLDFLKLKGGLLAQNVLLKYTTERWTSLEDVKNIYKGTSVGSTMHRPECVDHWMDDKWFGRQRLQGVNPVLIRLCKEIPGKLAVTSEMLEPFLEGRTLSDAVANNRIFIIDLELLSMVHCKHEPVLVSPIALFYLDKEDELTPICIQLFQQPGPENPVYFPSDPPLTWTMAKMFFNMGDAQQHQSCTHLGLTHLLMESMCIATHRNLSPSHPIFRLLAPHFLYLLAINKRGLEKLIAPGGWVDTGMTVGVCGMFQLISKGFQQWRLDKDGSVVEEIKSRGVLDPAVLPNYPYRDDAVDLYRAIERYITNVVKYYYDTPEKLEEDWEVQAWARELGSNKSDGGAGIGGVPVHLDNVEQLAQLCTTIVSTCSLGHAAANFQQYDAYGFVPNYPGILIGLPPKQKREMTEQDLLNFLPDKGNTLDIMVITKLLSMKGTKSLGDFEVQYHYEPAVVHMADEFRLELKKLSHKIEERNKTRKHKYDWLDPVIVPNSISI